MTLGSREKHLNLLSHGGVLFLINPGTIIRYRAPPNPPTQPCQEDFSKGQPHVIAGYGLHLCGTSPAEVFLKHAMARLTLLCFPAHPHHVGVTSVKVSKAFHKCVARWLNLMTLRSREKHLNLLSHGGVLFLINPGTTIRYNMHLQQYTFRHI